MVLSVTSTTVRFRRQLRGMLFLTLILDLQASQKDLFLVEVPAHTLTAEAIARVVEVHNLRQRLLGICARVQQICPFDMGKAEESNSRSQAESHALACSLKGLSLAGKALPSRPDIIAAGGEYQTACMTPCRGNNSHDSAFQVLIRRR